MKSISIRSIIWRVLLVLIGSLIAAVGVNLFLVPFKLLTAGVSGVALLVHYIFPAIPAGLMIVALNIPILISGWIFVDREFTIWSMVGMVLFSICLDLTAFLAELNVMTDLHMALVAGGLIAGIGTGLVFRARASLGGTDIIAAILRKYYSTTIGTTQFLLNMAIVSALGAYFTLEAALASIFSIFFEAYATDKTILGIDSHKALMIISDKSNEIAQTLMNELGRGATYFYGKGAYEHGEKRVIYCVITPRQLAHAKLIISRIDPACFSTVHNVNEVIGNGFSRLPI